MRISNPPPASVLLDTNVLVRATLVGDPHRQTAIDAIDALEKMGVVIHICPQNMQEFRQVATRPTAANGLGWTSADTAIVITGFEQRYVFTPETPAIYSAWRLIVEGCSAVGRANFDARLMAIAATSGIDAVLSFEAASFVKYSLFALGIVVLDPNSK